ncbi:MAG: SufD family Fe-S cluster assembly protein [Candidatus Micrarchaeota archaeon]
MKSMSVTGRKEIIIEEDSIVKIADGSEVLVIIKPIKNIKIELDVGEKCTVQSYIFQNENVEITQTNHIGSGSEIYCNSIWISGGKGKITNLLEGDGSQAHDIHIFSERGSSTFNLDARLNHAGKNTEGKIIVKGIVHDSATANLDGMIKIEKNGSGAESILKEHVMLLGPKAHATAKPELEIENNDVNSTHAASVSAIDENKMFYLMSRGIERKEAEKMIVTGFLDSGINLIPDENMKNKFLEIIHSHL